MDVDPGSTPTSEEGKSLASNNNLRNAIIG